MVVPTLGADESWRQCLHGLAAQTFQGFEVIIVDNSGSGRVQDAPSGVRVIANRSNVGFGAAINQGIRAAGAPFVVALNDDAESLERLVSL